MSYLRPRYARWLAALLADHRVTAAAGGAFVTNFNAFHVALGFRPNSKAPVAADHNADARVSRPLLNDRAAFCGGVLHNVIVRKGRGDARSGQRRTSENGLHGSTPWIVRLPSPIQFGPESSGAPRAWYWFHPQVRIVHDPII